VKKVWEGNGEKERREHGRVREGIPPHLIICPTQRFATVHFPGRQTDRPTDRWFRRNINANNAKKMLEAAAKAKILAPKP